MHGPKHHILATVQPAWEQIEATFGSKFWPLYLANSGLPTKITVLHTKFSAAVHRLWTCHQIYGAGKVTLVIWRSG